MVPYCWAVLKIAQDESSENGHPHILIAVIPTNRRHRPNVEPLLGHRLRRRPNIGPTLGRCILFAGMT